MEKWERIATLSWDAPYRAAASVVGIALMLTPFLGTSALGALAGLSNWLHASWLAEPLVRVDSWMTNQLGVVGPWGLLLVAVSTMTSYTGSRVLTRSRATATYWVAVVVASYTSPSWVILTVTLASAAMVSAVLRLRGREGFWSWLEGIFFNLAGGLFWAPFVAAVWLLGPGEGRRAQHAAS